MPVECYVQYEREHVPWKLTALCTYQNGPVTAHGLRSGIAENCTMLFVPWEDAGAPQGASNQTQSRGRGPHAGGGVSGSVLGRPTPVPDLSQRLRACAFRTVLLLGGQGGRAALEMVRRSWHWLLRNEPRLRCLSYIILSFTLMVYLRVSCREFPRPLHAPPSPLADIRSNRRGCGLPGSWPTPRRTGKPAPCSRGPLSVFGRPRSIMEAILAVRSIPASCHAGPGGDLCYAAVPWSAGSLKPKTQGV